MAKQEFEECKYFTSGYCEKYKSANAFLGGKLCDVDNKCVNFEILTYYEEEVKEG